MDNKDKLAEWLNQKWTGGIACPVCKKNDWELPDHLWELRQFNKGNLIVGGPIIPLTVIICNNCGFTMHFNAIKTGLITPDSQQPSTEK